MQLIINILIFVCVLVGNVYAEDSVVSTNTHNQDPTSAGYISDNANGSSQTEQESMAGSNQAVNLDQLLSNGAPNVLPNSQADNKEPPTKTQEERIAELESANSAMQTKIIGLEERLAKLESGEATVEKKYSSGFYGKLQQYADRAKNYLGVQLFIAIISGVIILLLLILIYLVTGYNRKSVISIANYPSAPSVSHKDELGLIDSENSNAAKLNLARAYIEMGHNSQAQSVLYEVLAHGTDDEQEEAKAMIDQLKHPDK